MKDLTRLFLTFLAGYCDTATFVHMKGVFSAHVTGNFIVFAAAMTRGIRPEDYLKLATFPVFILAVLLGTLIYTQAGRKEDRQTDLRGLGRILLAMACLIWVGVGLALMRSEPFDILVTILVVLAMGMQNVLHHFIPGSMTTVMTGTVMNTVARMTRRVLRKDTSAAVSQGTSTAWLILMFAAGCFIAAFATLWFGYLSLLIPALIVSGLWVAEQSGKKSRAGHVET